MSQIVNKFLRPLTSGKRNDVYNNVKNSHAPFTEEQKQEIQEWLNNHPDENIASFSDIYNVSIDYCMEQKGNREANQIIGRLSTWHFQKFCVKASPIRQKTACKAKYPCVRPSEFLKQHTLPL